LLRREQALLELRRLYPNDPGRKALEAQIAEADKELANLDPGPFFDDLDAPNRPAPILCRA